MENISERDSFQNQSSDLKLELQRYLRWWPLFIVSVFIALFIAWVYLRYATPQYLTSSSLYVKIQSAKKGELMGVKDFQNMALPSGLMTNAVDNELSILKSKPLLYNVVKEIGLDVKVISGGKFKDTDLYEKAPFSGSIIKLNEPRYFKSHTYSISPDEKNGFILKNEKSIIKGKFSKPLKMNWGWIVLNRNTNFSFVTPLTVSFINPRIVVNQLEASITLSIPEEKSNIIEISTKGTIPIRSENILNELMKQYNIDAIKDKNEEALATANFIDQRLEVITKELGGIEDEKESFKEANKIADLQSQIELDLKNASENTKKIMEMSTQLEMVNSVLKIASNSGNEQLLPTNLGMPSALDEMVGEYNQLVLSRNRTLRQATPSNPAVLQFNREIVAMRDLIKENLKKSQVNIQMGIGQLQAQMNKSREALGIFPMQEKLFRSIERQQNLKESLFLYLLQKREETAIALSANTEKARVVNPAYTADAPLSPNRKNVFLIAFSLGLLIPAGLLYIIFALDTKVHNRREIKKSLPEIPVIGEIPNAGDAEDAVVGKNDLTAFAESFRIMLTNAKFIIKPIKGIAPVIMVSSSVKGEGKTTVSTNTALTLAQNRKVLLLGADLRNPQLKKFTSNTKRGLSDYLANENENTIDQYIETFKDNSNLDILPSGTIPPNPTNLLANAKMEKIFNHLKTKYEFIIVDTAPMLLLSDSFHLIQYADLLLYVMRAEYTDRDILEFTEEVERDNAQGKLVIVLNDVKNRHISYYDNKYGYGYGYYSDDEETNKKMKWKKRFSNFFS
jgi:capsular exopolysaccharide synthesis family protein